MSGLCLLLELSLVCLGSSVSHLLKTVVIGSGPVLGKNDFIFVCPHLQTTYFQAFTETSGHKLWGVGEDFPGDSFVRDPSANARDPGGIPGLGRFPAVPLSS